MTAEGPVGAPTCFLSHSFTPPSPLSCSGPAVLFLIFLFVPVMLQVVRLLVHAWAPLDSVVEWCGAVPTVEAIAAPAGVDGVARVQWCSTRIHLALTMQVIPCTQPTPVNKLRGELSRLCHALVSTSSCVWREDHLELDPGSSSIVLHACLVLRVATLHLATVHIVA
jgi:hypothetical protein